MTATGERDRADAERTVALGAGARWIGPGAFALAAAVFALALAFESHAASLRPSIDDSLAGVGAAAFTPREFVAHVEWRAAVVLLVGGCVAAALVSARSIAEATRRAPRQMAVIAATGATAIAIHAGLDDPARPVALMEQVRLLLMAHSAEPDVAAMGTLALWPKRCAEAVALLVGVAAASTVILPSVIDLDDLKRRVRRARELLYTTAVLFVLAIFATASAYSWLVTLFPAPDEASASALQALVTAGTLSAGAFYSLMLTAIYLPAALTLEAVGRSLSPTDPPAGEAADDWLAQRGLSFSWSGQLARLGTVLAPLASSAAASLLAATP